MKEAEVESQNYGNLRFERLRRDYLMLGRRRQVGDERQGIAMAEFRR